jgi:4-hydroxy-tetrahydrodipicolinate synthase
MPLYYALFIETNPIPAKTSLGMMGVIDPELRLPLTPMSAQGKKELRKVLKDSQIL